MFTSLGYVTELEEAAERGKSEIRSRVTVGEADVRRAVGRAFPDADSITIHGDPMAGAGGVTYVVSLGDPESKYVLKFAPEEAADHLRNGVAVSDHLDARTAVPVPSVRAIETEDTEVPYPYAIVEYVPGDELSSIEQFESFPCDRQRSIVREMGRVLGTLHAQTQFETYGALAGCASNSENESNPTPTRTSGDWTRQATFTADDASFGDWFGFSVAVSSNSNTVIVGAVGDEGPNRRSTGTSNGGNASTTETPDSGVQVRPRTAMAAKRVRRTCSILPTGPRCRVVRDAGEEAGHEVGRLDDLAVNTVHAS